MKSRSIFFSLFITVSLFILSCAQQVAPTGGPIDTTPPEVLKASPENNSLNYKNEEISLHFDEYIKLNQLKKEFLSSPPLKYDLETHIKGKSLNIKIKDTLKENTTYVLNFGKAIVDITENNPLNNFQYVFSTGDNIDSLSISGRIVNAQNLKVEADALIMLYEKHDNDSIIAKERPNYVSRSNNEGLFTIGNLREGEYQLYAIQDKNNNFLFDTKEAVAFLDEAIYIDDKQSKDSLKLYLFEEEDRKQFLEERKQQGPKLSLQFKEELTDLNFNLIDTTNKLILYHEISEDLLFADIWFNEMPKERLKLEIIDDTLYRDTINIRIDSLGKDTTLGFAQKLSNRQAYYKPYEIEFKRPILNFDTSKITLLKDSIPLEFELIQDSSKASLFYLKADLSEDSSYTLSIDEGAFTDYYQKSNDSTGQKFKLDNSYQYCQLSVQITAETDTPLLLQLTSEDGEKVLETFKVEKKIIDINYLKAGAYGLKLIFDSNNNGKWDTGNYYEKLQAEQVWIYKDKIELREGWDQEIEWVINL